MPIKPKKKLRIKKKRNGGSSESILSTSPIYDLLHTFEKAPDQWTARYILIASAVILRSAVGLGSYSGEGEYPINGDFEAQRHWMELTINLPIEKWYFFDLEYWGLDYPPLTAYHSYFIGKIGSYINPEWFALNTSRGIENSGVKSFMRASSLLSELIFYFPALFEVVSLVGRKLNLRQMDKIVITSIIMCQPCLILIDHGHFQFNSVMLGLFLFSLAELIKGNYIFASYWFIGCINFKQMGLYYAPCIFIFLFAKLFPNYYDPECSQSIWKQLKSFNFSKLLSLAIAVITANILVLIPFIYFPRATYKELFNIVRQIFTRVFPFERGLFEDKVGNFWCTANIIVKFKNIFTTQQLARLSLLTTLLSILPPSVILFYKVLFSKSFASKGKSSIPSMGFIYAFSSISWGFYLFSYMVHEKTVLIPLLPSTLLYLSNEKEIISMILWINNVSAFSLWPLLKKETLQLQYFAILFLSNWLIGAFNSTILFPKSRFWRVITSVSYIAMISAHLMDYNIPAPVSFPDIWIILNTSISFGCFSLFWLWLIYKLYIL